MKVICKYQILDASNLTYGMYREDGTMIENKRITDEKVPLGGIASNVGWLKQDVHRCTDEIKEMHPEAYNIEYQLLECDYGSW